MSASFRLLTDLPASPERVFDLSLDVGFHVRSMAAYRERVVAGPVDRHLLSELGGLPPRECTARELDWRIEDR